VVVDGASTDGTVEMLRARNDPRLQWISEPDAGIYDAMAKAVRRAAGRWIVFLGADDRLRPGALREMAGHLHEANTLYYGDVWMTEKKIRYAGRFPAWKLALKNICQQAIFYPRSVFEAHAFEEQYAIQADWVLNMACRRDPRFRMEYVPMVVADFNDAGGVSSVRRDLAIERDYVMLLNRYFPAWISWPLSAAVFGWRLVKRKKMP
jgi:glycosyltransferase involved in cell wall biosynthesis